jgi:CRISPR-associated protein Csm4
VPEIVRLQEWEEAARKSVKRAAWLSAASFTKAQRGASLMLEDFISTAMLTPHRQTHNTLDRLSDTTGNEGSLFQKPETVLSAEGLHLSVYARVTEAFKPTLLTLFQQLAETGFGADTSIGKGQFEWLGCEPVTVLDEVANANGAIALSTFQPAPGDPTKGFWEAFVKYGKVAPDPGVANVFKRPLVMLQPGACFKTDVARSYLGRAIPMDELLPAEEANQLRTRGINLTQWAFGLTVPAHFTQEELWSEL